MLQPTPSRALLNHSRRARKSFEILSRRGEEQKRLEFGLRGEYVRRIPAERAHAQLDIDRVGSEPDHVPLVCGHKVRGWRVKKQIECKEYDGSDGQMDRLYLHCSSLRKTNCASQIRTDAWIFRFRSAATHATSPSQVSGRSTSDSSRATDVTKAVLLTRKSCTSQTTPRSLLRVVRSTILG